MQVEVRRGSAWQVHLKVQSVETGPIAPEVLVVPRQGLRTLDLDAEAAPETD